MARPSKQRSNYRFRRSGEGRSVHWSVAGIPLSQKERAMRRRQIALMFVKCLAVSVAVIFSISFLFKVWGSAYRESGNFQVGDIQFQTNGRLLPREIAAATGIRPDMDLLSIDLGAAYHALVKLPQVREASVERVLPNNLSIRVDERQPIAWLKCKHLNIYPRSCDKGRLLDENGILFPCTHLYNEYARLPVIQVAELAEAELGKTLPHKQAGDAITLLRLLSGPKCPEGLRVREIAVEHELSVKVIFESGLQVEMPLDAMEAELDRLRKILQISSLSGNAPATINLIPRRNVPVTFFAIAEESTEAEAPAETEETEPETNQQPEPDARPAPPAGRRTEPVSPPRDKAKTSEDESIQAILRGT